MKDVARQIRPLIKAEEEIALMTPNYCLVS